MAKNKRKTPAGGAKPGATGKKSSQSGAKPVTKSAKTATSKKTAPKTASKPAPKPAAKKPASGRPEPRRQPESAAAMSLRRRKDASRPAMSSLDYACLAAGAALAAYGVFIFASIEFAAKSAGGYILGALAFAGGVLLACLGSPVIRNFLVPARDPMDNYEVVTPGSESRARQTAATTAAQKPPITQSPEAVSAQVETIEDVEHEPAPPVVDSQSQDKNGEDNSSL